MTYIGIIIFILSKIMVLRRGPESSYMFLLEEICVDLLPWHILGVLAKVAIVCDL